MRRPRRTLTLIVVRDECGRAAARVLRPIIRNGRDEIHVATGEVSVALGEQLRR